jgi:hypothetical protein
MDPYIESQGLWPDFHVKFINYLQETLADLLPDAYEVRIDERVNFIQVQDESTQRIRPDVSVAKVDSREATSPATTSTATLEPVTLPETIEEEVRQAYIEILNRGDRSLVTILEVLSPANKTEPGRATYMAKRGTIIQQPVHLVELDLLRAGRRHQFGRALPPGDYYAMVSRVETRFDCDVYAWSLRQTLPTIPIPLAAPDPDVLLDLQAVFSITYERGRYQRSIDYRQPLVLALSEEDQRWADAVFEGGR